MGGPLSVLVADIFMDHLGSSLLAAKNNDPVSGFLYYKRQVDNINGVWADTDDQYSTKCSLYHVGIGWPQAQLSGLHDATHHFGQPTSQN